jgi:hypothetical protein
LAIYTIEAYLAHGSGGWNVKFEGPHLLRAFLPCHPMVKGRKAIEQLGEYKRRPKSLF